MTSTTTKSAMVNLNVNDRYEATEKVSLYIFLLSIPHLLFLTLVLLLLDCCAVYLTFEQIIWRGAVVSGDVVFRELGIFERRINLKRKGKFFSLFFYPTSFPFNHWSSSLVGYVNGRRL